MKLSLHKQAIFPAAIMAAASITCLGLAQQADAGVTWTFEQVGTSVVGTATGSFSISVARDTYLFNPTIESIGIADARAFNAPLAPVNIAFTAGTAESVLGINTNADPDATTGLFGHVNGDLGWDPALGETLGANVAIDTFTPITMTFENHTMGSVFASTFFDNGSVLAWTLNGGASTDTITYVAAVPEPSSTALLGLGGLGLLLRRRR